MSRVQNEVSAVCRDRNRAARQPAPQFRFAIEKRARRNRRREYLPKTEAAAWPAAAAEDELPSGFFRRRKFIVVLLSDGQQFLAPVKIKVLHWKYSDIDSSYDVFARQGTPNP